MKIWESIAGKIWLTLVGFSLLLLLPLGLLFSSQFAGFFFEREAGDLANRAAVIAAEEDPESAKDLALVLARELGAVICVGDGEGNIDEVWGRPGLGPGGGQGGPGPGWGMGPRWGLRGMGPMMGHGIGMTGALHRVELSDEDKALLRSGGVVVKRAEMAVFDGPTLYVAAPLLKEGKVERVIYLFAAMGPISQQMENIRRWVFGASAAALLMATLAAWVLSHYVSRPLKGLHEVAERMGQGDFSRRAEVLGKDEIGRLGNTLNTMAERLAATLGELEEKNAQLARGVQSMKDLVANVSHDLRTPLFLIKGYAEAIQDELPKTPEERHRMAGAILEETGRMEKLVQDLLQLSRLESGYYTFEKGEVRPGELVAELVQRLEGVARERGVELRAVGEEPGTLGASGTPGVSEGPGVFEAPGVSERSAAPVILADRARLEQALTNLLDNALRHTPAGGSVTLGAVAEGEGVCFTVSDTGTGIPPEDLPHVWDRFYRGEKSRNRKTAGTGLGLAIVKAIVEGHGGKADVTSSPAGTEFRLWLPLNR